MKKQINLYQPSCYPKREKATFKQFLALLGICFFAVFILILTLNNQLATTEEATVQHKALLTKKQAELSGLVIQLQNKRAPEEKVRRQHNLQEEIAAKQRLLANLSGIELEMTVSFSQLMRGLSLADIRTISIDEFSIIDGRLNITGQAKYSDSVALWLTKVQSTKELADIGFEKLTISDNNDGGAFSFKLTNSVTEETVKVQAQ
jgi:hypothetical protein